jgi:hypothetical protein
LLRLTLRSGRDGRLLARIIDRDGNSFVLDYGDPGVVRDASRRLLRGGFSVWRGGDWVTATPRHPDMIHLLAAWYAREGLLVFLDEPTWSGRPYDLEEVLPAPDGSVGGDLLEDDTERISREELERVMEKSQDAPVRTTWTPPDTEEELTEPMNLPDLPTLTDPGHPASLHPVKLSPFDAEAEPTELAPFPTEPLELIPDVGELDLEDEPTDRYPRDRKK